MSKYAICEIKGKQYRVIPGIPFEVDFLGDDKKVAAKVLLLEEDGKLKIGKPYLKENLALKVVENIQGKKIRVAKYHAKANFRRIRGFRPKITKVVFRRVNLIDNSFHRV